LVVNSQQIIMPGEGQAVCPRQKVITLEPNHEPQCFAVFGFRSR